MLSANATSMPSKALRPSPTWQGLRRFLQRLFSPAGVPVPDLPDDLRGDLGLMPAAPEGREAQFWDEKRGSEARDTPL